MRYYLAFLNGRGIPAREAVIHYPLRRDTVTVSWNDEAAEMVDADLAACELVVSGLPPAAERKPYCKRCAYEEVCFA